ncbi:hypothetical protein G4Z16_00880 [Streptomyces bathyalis]|uniref:Uncharacterized protein n=1 Tax=Streptomyces bathyalis TaxID=2710756 RepID=A0A7T1T2G1_9ACTN|nr:hypothetical protein [Streptomyces bathyalis]QPP05181.1 hypothetical protein G4Z16_00880 [Streptomyces bathyalis]
MAVGRLVVEELADAGGGVVDIVQQELPGRQVPGGRQARQCGTGVGEERFGVGQEPLAKLLGGLAVAFGDGLTGGDSVGDGAARIAQAGERVHAPQMDD